MKYVRTTSGIYEVSFGWGVAHLFEKQARADTIEELCDELVLQDSDTNFCFVMNANHIKDIQDNWQNLMNNEYLKNHIIYGAIWTEWGLKYVAKMNKEGELELI